MFCHIGNNFYGENENEPICVAMRDIVVIILIV